MRGGKGALRESIAEWNHCKNAPLLYYESHPYMLSFFGFFLTFFFSSFVLFFFLSSKEMTIAPPQKRNPLLGDFSSHP